MEKLKILATPIWALLGLVAVGLVVWTFIAGLVAAGTYSIAPFYMPIGEWDGYFRVCLYLYSIFTITMVVGVMIEVPGAISRED